MDFVTAILFTQQIFHLKCLCLPRFSLPRHCQKIVVKSGWFQKKINRGDGHIRKGSHGRSGFKHSAHNISFIFIYIYIYIYIYYVKSGNEKSICHWHATLSFLPLHSSGILLHILFI